MNKALWILGGIALGLGIGFVTYLWDALDGKVNMLMGFVHDTTWVVGMLVLALEVLAWAFELVPGAFVVGGLIALVVELLTAFVLHLAFPLLKAFLPKPAPVS